MASWQDGKVVQPAKGGDGRQAGRVIQTARMKATAASTKAQADAERRFKDGPGAGLGRSMLNSMGLNLFEEAQGAVNYGLQGAKNAFGAMAGQKPEYSAREAYDAATQLERDKSQQFAADHPAQNAFGTVMGAVYGPGVLKAGQWAMKGKGLAQIAGRGAAVGGGYGAASGAGAGTDVESRAKGAAFGGAAGVSLGAAVPVAVRGVTAAAGAGKRLAAPAANAVVRATAKARGAKIDVASQVDQRLIEALQADKLTPQQIYGALAEWKKSGATSPQFQNLVGENTRALFRAAAGTTGEGRNVAVANADAVTSDLQGNMIGRTGDLTPAETRPANVVADELTAQRSDLATKQYAGPYAAKIALTPEAVSALSGPEGRAAIQRAMRAASANQDTAQLAELEALSKADPTNLGEVTAGVLDRVRIAMGERGNKAAQQGANDIARGLFGRKSGIDTALDAAPGLKDARATYKGKTGEIDALETGRAFLTSTKRPEEFAVEVGALPPAALDKARVGARQAIQDALGDRKAGSLEMLTKIASGTNMRRNLEALFGPEETARYISAAKNELKKVSDARFVSPNTGSQTENKFSDKSTFFGIPLSKAQAIGVVMDKLRRGATLTDAERAELVKIGMGEVEATIKRVAPKLKPRPASPPRYGTREVSPTASLAGTIAGQRPER